MYFENDRNLVYICKKIISDIHIYDGKLEYFIKLLIWWICWLGGIKVLWGKSEGVSSAFFVFALSQLMEFAPKLLNKRYFISKLLHGLFCVLITVVLLISTSLLFDKIYDATSHGIMNVLSLASLAYMSIDWFILLLSRDQDDDDKSSTSSAEVVLAEKFEKSLHAGSLGNVKKGN